MKPSLKLNIVEQTLSNRLAADSPGTCTEDELKKLFDRFKQEQSIAHNLETVEALLAVADPRLQIETPQSREYLVTFILECWSNKMQCFSIWTQLLRKLALTHVLAPLPDTIAQIYRDTFAHAACLAQTVPALYLVTRTYADFSDRFRQLTGSEWCPLNFSQLEVLLMSLIDDPILLSLDTFLDDLWHRLPAFKDLAQTQFWQRYERYEPEFATNCAQWLGNFNQSLIGMRFLNV